MSECEWRGWVRGLRLADLPSFIKTACWERGLPVELDIDKGWIRETVRFKVQGSAEQLKELGDYFNAAVTKYNNRGEK